MKITIPHHPPLADLERRLAGINSRRDELLAQAAAFRASVYPQPKAGDPPAPLPIALAEELQVVESAAAREQEAVDRERRVLARKTTDANRAAYVAIQRKTALAVLALAVELQEEQGALADLQAAGVDISCFERSARPGVNL